MNIWDIFALAAVAYSATTIYRKVNYKGETVETLGVGGEIIRMELPGSRSGDMLRGPVRNHRTENTQDRQN